MGNEVLDVVDLCPLDKNQEGSMGQQEKGPLNESGCVSWTPCLYLHGV